MIQELQRDALRYAELGGWFRHVGFWIGATFRFGTWAHSLPLPLRLPMRLVYMVAKLPWVLIYNVFIPAGPHGVQIGPGLCLIHPRNILIGHGTVIGEDCLVFHEVTLGHGAVKGMPRIGNKVDIYVGSRILGGVTVGDGSMIGANCVITRSVPAQSVVLSPPSRILSRTLLARAVGQDPEEGG